MKLIHGALLATCMTFSFANFSFDVQSAPPSTFDETQTKVIVDFTENDGKYEVEGAAFKDAVKGHLEIDLQLAADRIESDPAHQDPYMVYRLTLDQRTQEAISQAIIDKVIVKFAIDRGSKLRVVQLPQSPGEKPVLGQVVAQNVIAASEAVKLVMILTSDDGDESDDSDAPSKVVPHIESMGTMKGPMRLLRTKPGH